MKNTTSLSKSQQAGQILLDIARDLTASLAAGDRYQRLLDAVRRLVPCDAACLFRLDGKDLVPLAGYGLSDEALVHRYPRGEHPRLEVILSSPGPVRFPPDSELPDPFDGQLASDPRALEHIHACLGCPLTEGGEVVGAITADALAPGAFDGIDTRWLEALGVLAGAALRTTALIESLERLALHKDAVARELQRSALGTQIIGRSPAARKLLQEIEVVAHSDLPVLILGETGVGKELVAQQLHAESRRREEALIHVNCAALPESIAESELFGHARGAFTGAVHERPGKFEIADGATLFLDEVGELPLTVQPKLLRVLQQGEIQRVGEDKTHTVNVRVIAATNRDLEGEVEAGRFRADLYHRLAVYPLRVPPLRERREDIPLLAAHFLDLSRRRLGLGPVRLSPEARDRLAAAPWPGNVRELENVLSRAVLRASAGHRDRGPLVLEADRLELTATAPAGTDPTSVPASPDDARGRSLTERTREFQRRAVTRALEESEGNWAAAARRLGMHRSNLHHLAQRLGLRP
jgi:anaerobic nitric oxide reductase transcription regulator